MPRFAHRRFADTAAVFTLALLVRSAIVLTSKGGPSGNIGYDAGVYYTAADALIHGRLPYRDFVLLHPPANMLVLTPFATLGRLTTDHTGFMVANAAYMVLGALNAALVVRVAHRLQMSRGAALLGGTFYAVWFGAAGTEISSRLEPLSSFFFLCGLWFLTGDRASTRRNLLLGGAAVGAAATVKIWWVVPLIVVLAWQLRSASARRGVGWLAGGALGAMAIVCAPFFIAAPGAMWRMVVTDQLGRHTSTPPRVRLNDLASLHAAFPGLHGVGEVAVLAIIAAAVIGLGLAAWRVRAARLVVTIAAVQLVVLMSAPTYFAYYSGYLGVAFSLVVAAAAASRRELRTRRSRALGPVGARAVVVTAAALTAISLFRPNVLSVPFPGNQLAGKVSHVRCLMADSPMALIGLNALSRDLANGCPNWVDVSGRTYDVDSPSGKFVSRVRNAKWQRDIRAYLLSGNALILIRPATGLSPATRAAVSRGTVLARSGGYVVYEYRPG